MKPGGTLLIILVSTAAAAVWMALLFVLAMLFFDLLSRAGEAD